MAGRSSAQLREDAQRIWQAGVRAVDSRQLVRDHVRVEGDQLIVGEVEIALPEIDRILVVGAGKAGAGMAEGIVSALGPDLVAAKRLLGWINVPDDCRRPFDHITLHGARPAGVNEPTADGVAGTRRILEIVQSATPRDLCFCLLSGGGSALMPLPVEGVSLGDKQAITRHLSGAGANIEQLNTVRKQLSRVKGGGLARACQASQLFTLVISDVIGDPLDIIASGPTVADSSTPQQAVEILEKFGVVSAGIATAALNYLCRSAERAEATAQVPDSVHNLIIGNNATAVDAAGCEAERLGYSHAMMAGRTLEGFAEQVGEHLARMALQMRSESGPDCLITGGEPVVSLVPADRRGTGGRNQQLVLAALRHLLASQSDLSAEEALAGIALMAGGTDGEDGPTDAAGAFVDQSVGKLLDAKWLDPVDFLERNDAYRFFQAFDALIKTGPTHTNVCDLRVVTVAR